jgi:hypothetical protein
MAVNEKVKARILELYLVKHYTYRQIAKVLRLSLRDISDTIRDHRNSNPALDTTLRPETSCGPVMTKQDEKLITAVDAFELFIGGLSPVQVMVRLRIDDPQMVKRWYEEYLDLKGLGKVVEVYEKVKNPNISEALDFYLKRKKEGIPDEDSLQRLREERDHLQLSILNSELRKENDALQTSIPSLRDEVGYLQNVLPGMRKEQQELKSDLLSARYLEKRRAELTQFLEAVKQGAGRTQAAELIVEVCVHEGSMNQLGSMALFHTLYALAEQPSSKALLDTRINRKDLEEGLADKLEKDSTDPKLVRNLSHRINETMGRWISNATFSGRFLPEHTKVVARIHSLETFVEERARQ